jgi:hypothetical protein
MLGRLVEAQGSNLAAKDRELVAKHHDLKLPELCGIESAHPTRSERWAQLRSGRHEPEIPVRALSIHRRRSTRIPIHHLRQSAK